MDHLPQEQSPSASNTECPQPQIDVSSAEQTTLSQNSSGQFKTSKGKQKKDKWMQYDIHIEEPKQSSQYDLIIPEGSTEFSYREKIVPINVEQLYGALLLGHGAFGSVYSVVIKGPPDIPMAVKRVPRSMVNELTMLEMVGSGSSPYIIDYYCAVAYPGTDELCICMELMDTSAMAFYQAMHSLGEVPFNKLDKLVRRITHDIASGLRYLEIKEIIHRNVKPAKILINKNSVVKLCGFGISRSFTEIKSDFEDFVGTENYMPPKLEWTVQDDMWALGITLLEIVSGKHPFADWDQYGKFMKILTWEPSFPSTISEHMQQLILHLLKKEAQERPRCYVDILNKPAICDVTAMPSNDECDFVRHVIENIPRTGSSKE